MPKESLPVDFLFSLLIFFYGTPIGFVVANLGCLPKISFLG
jgi:hypothetical protein